MAKQKSEVQVDLDGPSWAEMLAGALLEMAEQHQSANPESSPSENTLRLQQTLKEFQKTYDRI